MGVLSVLITFGRPDLGEALDWSACPGYFLPGERLAGEPLSGFPLPGELTGLFTAAPLKQMAPFVLFKFHSGR